MQSEEISIYVHIPYCRGRCDYCDFVSSTNFELDTDAYVSLLIQELRQRQEVIEGKRPVSLYIGGGTPSLVAARDLVRLCEAVDARAIGEVTVELNPGDNRVDWFRELVEAGVNRFSIGGQAFSAERLRVLGRRHGVDQIFEAVEMAREAGARNVGIDYIYGSEGQSLEGVQEELTELLRLSPEHVSAYELTVAAGTRLGRRVESGEVRLPREERIVAMWEAIGRQLEERGLIRYEVSNFARAGYQSVHNRGYWEGRPYLALGVGAHGFVGDCSGRRLRYANTPELQDYARTLAAAGAFDAVGASGRNEEISAEDHASELVFLGMRTAAGVSLCSLKRLLPEDVYSQWMGRFHEFERSGELRTGVDSVAPSKKGMLLADYIAERVVSG